MNNFNKTNKSKFYEDGYCVFRKVFTNEEVELYKSEIKRIIDDKSKEDQKDLHGLYNHPKLWDVIVNKKLLDNLRYLLGKEIVFLHDFSFLHKKDENYSWHRDNPCRRFGIGPDWDKSEIYDVARVGIYLQSYDDTGSCLNLIPKSHLKRYTFQEIIRFIHNKLKNSKNIIINKFRAKLSKFIGTNIQNDPGDCVIFNAKTWHSPSPSKKEKTAIFFAFGKRNKHAENYVDYHFNYRSQKGLKNFDIPNDYKEFLKKNNIYYEIPKDKKNIEGVFVPNVERSVNNLNET